MPAAQMTQTIGTSAHTASSDAWARSRREPLDELSCDIVQSFISKGEVYALIRESGQCPTQVALLHYSTNPFRSHASPRQLSNERPKHKSVLGGQLISFGDRGEHHVSDAYPPMTRCLAPRAIG